MTKSQAAELAGRLKWACNALFWPCGCSFLTLMVRRAMDADPLWQLNARLRRSLTWWASRL